MKKKRKEFNQLLKQFQLDYSDIEIELKEPFIARVKELAQPILAKVVVEYLATHEAYEEIDYYDRQDENDLVRNLGDYNLLDYSTLSDLAYRANGDVEQMGHYYGTPEYRYGDVSWDLENLLYEVLELREAELKKELESYCGKWFATLYPQTREEEIDALKQLQALILTHCNNEWMDCLGEFCTEFLEEAYDTPLLKLFELGYSLISLEEPLFNYTENYSEVESTFIQLLSDLKEKFKTQTITGALDRTLELTYLQLIEKALESESVPFYAKSLFITTPNQAITILNHLSDEEHQRKALETFALLYASTFETLCDLEETKQSDFLVQMFQSEESETYFLKHGITEEWFEFCEKLTLKTELLTELPEEPKDYYPLARQQARHFVLHLGETNTGKTYFSLERLKQSQKGVYLAPLRLLALEVQERLMANQVPCHLLTGEEELWVEGAQHVASTIEKLNIQETYEVAVIDEGQMIEDEFRGSAWTSAILGVCANEIHICAAPHAKELLVALIEYCQDTYEIIEHHRSTELTISQQAFNFVKDIQKGDAIVVFSKRKVLNVAAKLMKERQLACSLLYGALPYQSRAKQFQQFVAGETSVLVTTDAVGMGVNLPIKRIIILESQKFDGRQLRPLTGSELKQIGGRAGRQGIYDQGEVIVMQKRMIQRFTDPINPLKVAPLGLTPHLLKLSRSLRETLELWDELTLPPLFKQVNLSPIYSRLNLAHGFHLTKEQEYKVALFPIDASNLDQATLFKFYLAHFAEGATQVPFPIRPALQYDDYLRQLEDYYKRLDLYYAFSKTFHLTYDASALLHEKEKVSQEINHRLISKSLQVATCNTCGREMLWNSDHYRCDACYQASRRSYSDWEEDWA